MPGQLPEQPEGQSRPDPDAAPGPAAHASVEPARDRPAIRDNPPESADTPPGSAASAEPTPVIEGGPSVAEIEAALAAASAAGASPGASAPGADGSVHEASHDQAAPADSGPAVRMDLPDFGNVAGGKIEHGIDLLGDVELDVKIELGRAQMLIEDVLKLGEGSVVELDKLAGDPVDVLVNERLVARGEVLVLNDSFCVRISEIVADTEPQAA